MPNSRASRPSARVAALSVRRATICSATLLLAGAALAVAAAPAHGQAAATDDQIFACSSQQELEQTMQSDGSIVPDGCRAVSVNSLNADGEALCLLDFGAGEEGILGQLQDAALPSEWWVECDALATAIAD